MRTRSPSSRSRGARAGTAANGLAAAPSPPRSRRPVCAQHGGRHLHLRPLRHPVPLAHVCHEGLRVKTGLARLDATL